MSHFSYQDSPYPIREDLKQQYQAYWRRLAKPGSWWTGVERVAIAQEVRNAASCSFCAQRREALSPSGITGEHDSSSSHLTEQATDVVHRIITDQTRISESWVEQLKNSGLSNAAYVELAGVVVAVFSIDEFNRALGLAWEPLPEPAAGEPDHYIAPQAIKSDGFVPMIPAGGASGDEADLFPDGRSANVLRALTLIPQAVRDWLSLSAAQYLSIQGMANLVKQEDRAINRLQMELIAGRVSALNECFY